MDLVVINFQNISNRVCYQSVSEHLKVDREYRFCVILFHAEVEKKLETKNVIITIHLTIYLLNSAFIILPYQVSTV